MPISAPFHPSHTNGGFSLIQAIITLAVLCIAIVAGARVSVSALASVKNGKLLGEREDLRIFIDQAMDCGTLISMNRSSCSAALVDANLWQAHLSCAESNFDRRREITVGRFDVRAKCRREGNGFFFSFEAKDPKRSNKWLSIQNVPKYCPEVVIDVPKWSIHRVGTDWTNGTLSPSSEMRASVEFAIEDYFTGDLSEFGTATVTFHRFSGTNASLNRHFKEGPAINARYSGEDNFPVMCGRADVSESPHRFAIPNLESPMTDYHRHYDGKLKREEISFNVADDGHKIRLTTIRDGYGDCRVKPETGCNATVCGIKVTLEQKPRCSR